MSATADQRRCPVEHYAHNPGPAPAGTLFRSMDARRERARPAFWSEEAGGYWVFTDPDVILDGLQRPDLWSSSVLDPTNRDPAYPLVPVMTAPPDHAKWRQLL